MKLTHGGRSSARRNSGASRTVKRLGALGALALAALVTSGCSPEEAVRFGWPSGITPAEKAEMFDLAGRERKEAAPDLPVYIMDEDIPHVRLALRKASRLIATDRSSISLETGWPWLST